MIRISFRKDPKEVDAIAGFLERRTSDLRTGAPSDSWPTTKSLYEVFVYYAFEVSIGMTIDGRELLEVDECGTPCDAPEPLVDAMGALRSAVASLDREGDFAGWEVWDDIEPATFRVLAGARVFVEVESNGRSAVVDLAELKAEALRVSREAADWIEESLPDGMKESDVLRCLARLRAPLEFSKPED